MRNQFSLAVVGVAAISSHALAGAFVSSSDIVVATLNGGITTAAPTVTLNEFNTSSTTAGGSAVNSVTFDSTGANSLRGYGSTGGRDGTLNLSADGSQLVYAGYRLNGTSAVATDASNSRVIGVVTSNGITDASRSPAGASDIFRSATTADNQNYYFTQNTSNTAIGLYKSNGAVTDINDAGFRSVYATPTQLFASTGSTPKGIYAYNGFPTSTSDVPTNLSGDSIASIVALDLNPNVTGVDTIYAVGSSGAVKLTKTGTTWSDTQALATSSGTLYGVAAKVNSQGKVDLYYSTDTSIYRFLDTGYGSTFTNVNGSAASFSSAYETAAAGTQFRGISFAPTAVPEPASLALVAAGGCGALMRRRRTR